jgi:anthranilate synthase component 2
MIVLVDNYDSFSYNLYQLVGSLNPDIRVVRNDALTVDQLLAEQPQAVILSPGPGRPEDAGICLEAARRVGQEGIPVLGVCLGHQAICAAYGATVGYAKELMHGKQSVVTVDRESPLFAGLPEQLPVARYHSLAALKDTIPDALKVIAETEDGEIMAVSHKEYPIYGVQFHPESILTPDGKQILQNFLALSQR